MRGNIDQLLHIKTGGIREWGEGHFKYHRHESTSYEALEALLAHHSFQSTDHFIDVGCGNGRVAFYIHHFAQIAVTGIEAHPLTFRDLLDNQETYELHHQTESRLMFKQLYVEQYFIERTASVFYFFNPFHIRLFKQFIGDILTAYQMHPRSIQIILYYPSVEYEEFIERHSAFQFLKQIDVATEKDANERIIIYELT